jgi:Ser/Thr protein kinase RdoA (MazF antagonist)
MAEVGWVHDLLAFAAQAIPAVVAPVPTLDGSTAFRWGRRPVAVFPFIDGVHLNREDAPQRRAAAHLLARLHATLRAWPAHRPRPPHGPGAPATWPRVPDPAPVEDPALDAWHAEWARARAPLLPVGPVHGDFYRRNLLCRDGRIVGVIDWDDARPDVQLREVAWAAWEFGKVGGDRLDVGRATAFLQAYAEAGGDLPADADHAVIPLIRWHLREEIRRAHAAMARGCAQSAEDREYTDGEVRAFGRLRDARLPSTS